MDAQTQTPERRAGRRGRVLLTGKLVYGDGLSVDCTIRDLTEAGAKVTLSDPFVRPKEGWLIVVRDGTAHKTRVLWSRHPHLGLAFDASYPLNDEERPLRAELRPLRKLWLAIAPTPY